MSFTVRSSDERFAEALRWHLAPFHRSTPPRYGFPVDLEKLTVPGRRRASYVFRFATVPRFTSPLLAQVLSHAVWVIHDEVRQRVRDFLLLHAGGVTRDGDALLLPARTHCGKSSLTLGLLRAGFRYLSDELGVLDPISGRAWPCEKHVKLRPEALEFFPGLEEGLEDRKWFRLRDRFVRPGDVGASVGTPADVRWVIFPTSDWEGPPRLSRVPKAEALELMAANSLNLYRYQDRGVVLLSRVAKQAEAFRLDGGSIRERVEAISEATS